MANRRMLLSKEGKEILDLITEYLEVDRPTAIKISLSKGLQISYGEIKSNTLDSKDKWTIPDNIIKENDFLLFKHLIQNEAEMSLDEESLHKLMIFYIESGLRVIHEIYQEKTSMEDLRISIL
ncbi:hypothetical protein [Oceanobacillus kapialis]|uniref:hypothetical protein n=1 Tax=Oceanobacillus kapialis TaxID=481353 RepID=UPI003850CF9B